LPAQLQRLVLSGRDLVCFFKWFLCGVWRGGWGLIVVAKKDQWYPLLI